MRSPEDAPVIALSPEELDGVPQKEACPCVRRFTSALTGKRPPGRQRKNRQRPRRRIPMPELDQGLRTQNGGSHAAA